MQLSTIIKAIETSFPLDLAFEGDKVGLQIGDLNKNVTKVTISIDLTKSTLKQAIKNNCELIIVHHPFIFRDSLEEELKYAPYKKSILEEVRKNNIAVYALHSNFNASQQGMPKVLAKKLNLTPHFPVPNNPYITLFNFESLTVEALINKVEKTLDLKKSQFYKSQSGTVSNVVILPGRGSIDQILIAKEAGADVVITSDVRWSDWMTIEQSKINVICISHGMENIFSQGIKDWLLKLNSNLEITTNYIPTVYQVNTK